METPLFSLFIGSIICSNCFVDVFITHSSNPDWLELCACTYLWNWWIGTWFCHFLGHFQRIIRHLLRFHKNEQVFSFNGEGMRFKNANNSNEGPNISAPSNIASDWFDWLEIRIFCNTILTHRIVANSWLDIAQTVCDRRLSSINAPHNKFCVIFYIIEAMFPQTHKHRVSHIHIGAYRATYILRIYWAFSTGNCILYDRSHSESRNLA